MLMLLYILILLIINVKYILISALCNNSVTTVSGNFAPKKICSGDLIFEDNFDNLNLKVWQHENTLAGGAHSEFQWYLNNRSNSYVEDGILHIKPTFLADDYGEQFLYSGTLDVNGNSEYEGCTNAGYQGCRRTGTATHILNPIKSARIRTLQSFAFKYGKVEVRAKIPSGDWLWPAIWLMPKIYAYSHWPASGEIDIMESRGNKGLYNYTGENIGSEQVSCTLHWGPYKNQNRWRFTHFTKSNSSGFHRSYHSYQMKWTPEQITFYIDDEPIGDVIPPPGGFWEKGQFNSLGIDNPWKQSSSIMAPFDDEFYIILNLAVGGVTFFSDNAKNYPDEKPWKNNSTKPLTDFWENRKQWIPTWRLNTDDSHFKIDYVKVWAL